MTLYLYVWIYGYSPDLVSFDKGSLTSQMSPFLAYSGINDIMIIWSVLLLFFRDLGQGWPALQCTQFVSHQNKAASHNQHWLCLNFPFQNANVFSVLQMWSDAWLLAMRFVLCNSFPLFTWSHAGRNHWPGERERQNWISSHSPWS